MHGDHGQTGRADATDAVSSAQPGRIDASHVDDAGTRRESDDASLWRLATAHAAGACIENIRALVEDFYAAKAKDPPPFTILIRFTQKTGSIGEGIVGRQEIHGVDPP